MEPGSYTLRFVKCLVSTQSTVCGGAVVVFGSMWDSISGLPGSSLGTSCLVRSVTERGISTDSVLDLLIVVIESGKKQFLQVSPRMFPGESNASSS